VPTNLPIANTDDDEFAILRAQVEKALAGEITTGNESSESGMDERVTTTGLQ
jgi:hypothetical protein